MYICFYHIVWYIGYKVVYTNIDQTLVNSLQGLLNCEICGLDCRAVTTEYDTRDQLYTHVTPIL